MHIKHLTVWGNKNLLIVIIGIIIRIKLLYNFGALRYNVISELLERKILKLDDFRW